MENRFNLVDEPWIPIADHGRVSLRSVFSDSRYRSLGGNPVQKIALIKLMLSISQAAATPETEAQWQSLGDDGLAIKCLEYLDKWHDRFYLYGDQPFLQVPAICEAKEQPYGALLPEVSTGNTTVLSQLQVEREITDADRALLLLTLMGFALSGKKTDNSVVLTRGYAGKRNDKNKPSTGRPGPSIGYMGFLHSFVLGTSLQKTLWLNLLSHSQIREMGIYPEGLGTPPWEAMPTGEDCPVARVLRQSMQGRLIPLCRFCLLSETGLHYSEGIAHPGYKDGVIDTSIAVDNSSKEPKALWVNPEKRPWRELTALLSFIDQSDCNGFQSWQLRSSLDRARAVEDKFAIFSGGLRVSSTAGEQFVSGSDDYVESVIWIYSELLGQTWFTQVKAEMDAMDDIARHLYGRVMGFYKEQSVDASKLASQATHLFWQLCERDFQALVDACNGCSDAVNPLRRRFAGYIQQAFDQFCPRETARQLDAWAKCRPNTSTYLKQGA